MRRFDVDWGWIERKLLTVLPLVLSSTFMASDLFAQTLEDHFCHIFLYPRSYERAVRFSSRLVGSELSKSMEELTLINLQSSVDWGCEAAHFADQRKGRFGVIPAVHGMNRITVIQLHVQDVGFRCANSDRVLAFLSQAFDIQTRIENGIDRIELHTPCLVPVYADAYKEGMHLSKAQMGYLSASRIVNELATFSSPDIHGKIAEFPNWRLGASILQDALDTTRYGLV